MQLPLDVWDISLWLAITAIVLLITVELTSPHYGPTNLLINKKKLRNVTYVVSILFLATFAMKIAAIIHHF